MTADVQALIERLRQPDRWLIHNGGTAVKYDYAPYEAADALQAQAEQLMERDRCIAYLHGQIAGIDGGLMPLNMGEIIVAARRRAIGRRRAEGEKL